MARPASRAPPGQSAARFGRLDHRGPVPRAQSTDGRGPDHPCAAFPDISAPGLPTTRASAAPWSGCAGAAPTTRKPAASRWTAVNSSCCTPGSASSTLRNGPASPSASEANGWSSTASCTTTGSLRRRAAASPRNRTPKSCSRRSTPGDGRRSTGARACGPSPSTTRLTAHSRSAATASGKSRSTCRRTRTGASGSGRRSSSSPRCRGAVFRSTTTICSVIWSTATSPSTSCPRASSRGWRKFRRARPCASAATGAPPDGATGCPTSTRNLTTSTTRAARPGCASDAARVSPRWCSRP